MAPLHVMPWQCMRNVLKVARTRIVPRLVRLCVTVYAAMLLCNVAPGSFKQMYEQLYDWGDAHFLTLDHPSFASVFAPDPSSHMCLHSIVELFLKEDAEKIYIYAKIINNITILHWFLKILFHHPSIQDFHHIFRFIQKSCMCTYDR